MNKVPNYFPKIWSCFLITITVIIIITIIYNCEINPTSLTAENLLPLRCIWQWHPWWDTPSSQHIREKCYQLFWALLLIENFYWLSLTTESPWCTFSNLMVTAILWEQVKWWQHRFEETKAEKCLTTLLKIMTENEGASREGEDKPLSGRKGLQKTRLRKGCYPKYQEL